MTTAAVKTGSFCARVEKALQEVRTTVGKLERALIALTETQARKAEVERVLREARISEATGGHPAQTVEDLKTDLEVLREDVENAEARTVGLQRAVTSAKEELDTARLVLSRAQSSWIEAKAKAIRDRTDQAARAMQQVQQEAIALVRLLDKVQIKGVNQRDLDLGHIVYAEIVSSHGGGPRVWPQMGDRKTGNEIIASQMEVFLEQLEAL